MSSPCSLYNRSAGPPCSAICPDNQASRSSRNAGSTWHTLRNTSSAFLSSWHAVDHPARALAQLDDLAQVDEQRALGRLLRQRRARRAQHDQHGEGKPREGTASADSFHLRAPCASPGGLASAAQHDRARDTPGAQRIERLVRLREREHVDLRADAGVSAMRKNSSPSLRVRFATERTLRSSHSSRYGNCGMSLM